MQTLLLAGLCYFVTHREFQHFLVACLAIFYIAPQRAVQPRQHQPALALFEQHSPAQHYRRQRGQVFTTSSLLHHHHQHHLTVIYLHRTSFGLLFFVQVPTRTGSWKSSAAAQLLLRTRSTRQQHGNEDRHHHEQKQLRTTAVLHCCRLLLCFCLFFILVFVGGSIFLYFLTLLYVRIFTRRVRFMQENMMRTVVCRTGYQSVWLSVVL